MSVADDFFTGLPSTHLSAVLGRLAGDQVDGTRKHRKDALSRFRGVIVSRTYRTRTRQLCVFLKAMQTLQLDTLETCFLASATTTREHFASAVQDAGWPVDEKGNAHFSLASGEDVKVLINYVPFWSLFVGFLIEISNWDDVENRLLHTVGEAKNTEDLNGIARDLDDRLGLVLDQHLPLEQECERFRGITTYFRDQQKDEPDRTLELDDDSVMAFWLYANVKDLPGDWKTFRRVRFSMMRLHSVLQHGEPHSSTDSPVEDGRVAATATAALSRSFSTAANDDEPDYVQLYDSGEALEGRPRSQRLEEVAETGLADAIKWLQDTRGRAKLIGKDEMNLLLQLVTVWDGPSMLFRTSLRDQAFHAPQLAMGGGADAADAVADAETFETVIQTIETLLQNLHQRANAVVAATMHGAWGRNGGAEAVRDLIEHLHPKYLSSLEAIADQALQSVAAQGGAAGRLDLVATGQSLIADKIIEDLCADVDARALRQQAPAARSRVEETGGGGADHLLLIRLELAEARKAVKRAALDGIEAGGMGLDELADLSNLLVTLLERLATIVQCGRQMTDPVGGFQQDCEGFRKAFATIYGSSLND